MGTLRYIFGLYIILFLTIPSFSQDNESTPVITGQTPSPLTTQENTPITITLNNLIVSDADPLPVYPDGFTLELNSGDNYEFSGTTVTPDAGFSGTLVVRVRVDDGENNSDWFDLQVDVIATPNVAPQITGQTPIATNQGQSTTLTLSQLTVTDPDNAYPTGFSLTVYAGSNYSFNGTTVTPASDFSGPLIVPVSVNDGEAESNVFELTIDVAEPQNVAPQITGQSPISINQGQSVAITLAQLTVTDPDDNYPTGFTLTIQGGPNYTVVGATVTPLATFLGDLKVPVSVNDGEAESNIFELTINVLELVNVVPIITGQTALAIDQGESLTITLAQLTVLDVDDTYPVDFTLTIYSGTNYTFTGTTITPSATFSGTLTVPVSVNDGKAESPKFNLKIDVLKVQPVAPQITAQKTLTTNEEQAITINLSDLTVVDPDNTYPQGFTLKISPGAHYSTAGSTITPAKDYSGQLAVTVSVNDGQNDSAPFNLQITVAPVNDPPVITGQKKLSTDQAVPLTITLSDLNVTDPDNTIPDDFTLIIKPGADYVAGGGTINPTPTFVGKLTVVVSVSDGSANSLDFNLEVTVVSTMTNVAPQIVAQKAISITQGTTVMLQFSHLVVEDPDNEYPVGFSIKISPGANYTANGTTITPAPSFLSGTLSVGVRVNDGTDDSNLYQVKIQVAPISATPRINGQRELTMMEDSTITIELSDLIVTDADNTGYPNGFTLKVLGDSEGVYQVNGTSVTPAPDLNGFIEVGITVSDGVNTSEEFRLAILVTPVNDAPRITQLETTPVAYEPGKEPAELFRRLVLADVDNDYLSMAEIGFRPSNFSASNDEILYDFDTTKIRAIYDPKGILFLIGYATVEEYQNALRSMRYNYQITRNTNGEQEDILTGSRTVYVNVNDGQSVSLNSERTIDIEAKVMMDIPSAFTPNGDNANDTWHLEVSNEDRLDQAIVKVYNKRGLLLYESDGFEQDWDGTFNGELLPVDTYYYTIVIKLPYVRQTYSGVVTILY